jgi:hypothetical protein
MSRAQLTSTVEQNTGGAVSPYVAGKNAVINGGMDIWQRGTTFTNPSSYSYTADRWAAYVGGNCVFARESTTVPSGAQYSLKMTANANNIQMFAVQAIETANAIALAGKTATLSIQVAASNSPTLGLELSYSTSTDNAVGGTWTAITATSGGSYAAVPSTFVTLSGVYAIPSTAKSLRVSVGDFTATVVSGTNFFVGNTQLEIGSVATPFSRAGGTLSGELTACQRYYYRTTGNGDGGALGMVGFGIGGFILFNLLTPVTMRAIPTAVDYNTTTGFAASGLSGTCTLSIHYRATATSVWLITNNVSSTANLYYVGQQYGASPLAFVGVSAEL